MYMYMYVKILGWDGGGWGGRVEEFPKVPLYVSFRNLVMGGGGAK